MIKRDYLSIENTNCLKGILSICVFLCHLWGNIASFDGVDNTNIIIQTFGRLCTVLGYLSVACFFFFSGYGLMCQYQKKGEKYLEGFLIKRVLPLYIVCSVFILFYSVANIALGNEIKPVQVIQSFLFGGTVISKGWYLQSILLWYIFFYVSFKIVNKIAKKQNIGIPILSVFFIVYLILCWILKLESTWYECCFCLILGVAFAMFKEKIESVFSSTVKFLLIVSAVFFLFMTSFVLGNYSILNEEMRIVSKCISAVSFSALVVLLMRILPIKNIITRFLGNIYLEIYILHGFYLMFFRSKIMNISNPYIYTGVTFLLTTLSAVLIHPLICKILSIGKIKKAKERFGNGNQV